MNFTSRPCSIRVAMPGGRQQRLPRVEFIHFNAVTPPRRTGRPLLGYGTSEGAAWFDALLADLDEPDAPASSDASSDIDPPPAAPVRC